MRAELIVTMDDGQVLRATANLLPVVQAPVQASNGETAEVVSPPLDFHLPTRAFMKRYAANLSGPRRLTLLISHLAQGQTGAPVARVDVVRLWNKMSSLLGGEYNGAYDTRARDNGWISSPKGGVFKLLDDWVAAIQ